MSEQPSSVQAKVGVIRSILDDMENAVRRMRMAMREPEQPGVSDYALICVLKEAAGRWEYSFHTKQASEPKNAIDMHNACRSLLNRFQELRDDIASRPIPGANPQ